MRPSTNPTRLLAALLALTTLTTAFSERKQDPVCESCDNMLRKCSNDGCIGTRFEGEDDVQQYSCMNACMCALSAQFEDCRVECMYNCEETSPSWFGPETWGPLILHGDEAKEKRRKEEERKKKEEEEKKAKEDEKARQELEKVKEELEKAKQELEKAEQEKAKEEEAKAKAKEEKRKSRLG
ncbi:hypothetical protein C7974DRAFT_455304 [Boeremia exigua]|uniref:uncharacterized protein n=1 Tax=Boeremia exigua TaxID=749465 RepID=UPI001E8DA116|nr:uncharacterized protein C7974DRAFT_455304 [Boeremia exigua]KAH6625323.1 hypothetical protein C7974DRAFT_455304 [Boeremia exigua]